jgi:hypothetical protein
MPDPSALEDQFAAKLNEEPAVETNRDSGFQKNSAARSGVARQGMRPRTKPMRRESRGWVVFTIEIF